MMNDPKKRNSSITSLQRVTLDTNVCGLIANPDDPAYDNKPDLRKAGKQLQKAIAAGQVRAFVSEASVFVECLEFSCKLTYLAVAGTFDPRPVPDPRRFAVFNTLAELGAKMLHAPLIGAEIFITNMPWSGDELFSNTERLSRFFDFMRGYPRHLPLKQFGENKLPTQPPVPPNRTRSNPDGFSVEMRQDWAVALKREWDTGTDAKKKSLRKQVGPMIAEWCDTMILASHFAYGNDIFCTCDEGGEAGNKSILHSSNRTALAQQKGVKIVDPREAILLLAN